ncbi:MAG: hypothetical protein ACFFEF_13360 [Candidatus Thorarchaeota archaeon]
MTYRHKREKCCPETKEILEEVLKNKKEEYGCIDCAETVRVKNAMEAILAEEASEVEIKSSAETIVIEAEMDVPSHKPEIREVMEEYSPPDDLGLQDKKDTLKTLKNRKNGAYLESKKNYRG